MSLTHEQIEAIADTMRSAGFDTTELDSDQLALLATCVLEALLIELPD